MMKWIKQIFRMNRTVRDTVTVRETSDAKEVFDIELKLKEFGIPFEVEITKSSIENIRREYNVKVMKQDVERASEILG